MADRRTTEQGNCVWHEIDDSVFSSECGIDAWHLRQGYDLPDFCEGCGGHVTVAPTTEAEGHD